MSFSSNTELPDAHKAAIFQHAGQVRRVHDNGHGNICVKRRRNFLPDEAGLTGCSGKSANPAF